MTEKNIATASETEQSDFTEPLKSCLLPSDPTDSDFVQHIQRIADESAVRDLAARFSDACNTRNIPAFRRLWMPDAVWEISEPMPMRAEGVDNITKLVEKMLGGWELFVQMTHSGIIRITGDTARARWTVHETARKPDSKGFLNNFAVYEDRLARVEGRWFFSKRKYEFIYLDESVLPGKSFPPDAELKI